jgi:hypothetical protein
VDLLLNAPTMDRELSRYYRRAFKNAVELFAVTAYLTDWDTSLKLNPKCRSFLMIVGRNFGITRKAACEKVMRWLPRQRKVQFMVADGISGFHPKALFWREGKARCFAIVGSSNLTQAAFETNYEANVFFALPEADYVKAKKWVRQIEKQSVPVSGDWLRKYEEGDWPTKYIGPPLPQHGAKGPKAVRDASRVVPLDLPRVPGMEESIARRRDQVAAYHKRRAGLMSLFRRCANGEINGDKFFEQLRTYWGLEAGDNRLQGPGWERSGKGSDFRKLSKSFVTILDTATEDRDEAVIEEIDRLAKQQVASRGSFLSEMLCLRFPNEYPVLNQPVKDYLKEVEYRAPRAASEGARFIHLARILRSSLRDDPAIPRKSCRARCGYLARV